MSMEQEIKDMVALVAQASIKAAAASEVYCKASRNLELANREHMKLRDKLRDLQDEQIQQAVNDAQATS